MMTQLQKQTYMQIASNIAKLSPCKKRKVGCIVVKENRIISNGHNKMPEGWHSCCEDEQDITKTKIEVMHAEFDAITKLLLCHEPAKNAAIFTSYRPCFQCATLIVAAEISHVFYADNHIRGNIGGLEFLRKNNVHVEYVLPLSY